MEMVMLILEVVRRLLQKAGPYLAVEIILPGGTLIALAIYLYRQRKIFFGAMSIWLWPARLMNVEPGDSADFKPSLSRR